MSYKQDNVDVNGSGDANDKWSNSKIFIGAIHPGLNENTLRAYFSQYGEIMSIIVKHGKRTNYAFIEYQITDSVERVLAENPHIINNSFVDVYRDKSRHSKFYVSGLSPYITYITIKNYFGRFGRIVKLERPYNTIAKKYKKFCFITFDDAQDVDNLLKVAEHVIGRSAVTVKPFKNPSNAK